MIDLNLLDEKLRLFCMLWPDNIDEFLEWKLRVETKNGHILDGNNKERTYRRLCKLLPSWKTYRPYDSGTCLRILKGSLEIMSEAYNQIRRYSLLEFSQISTEPLELIWHELGRVKEEHGERNINGYYYVISVCKPLVFLWGQTLGFDDINRANVPSEYAVPKDNRWDFMTWMKVMKTFQEVLEECPETVKFLKKLSKRMYGSDLIVPYGRFLDIYYWLPLEELKHIYEEKTRRKRFPSW